MKGLALLIALVPSITFGTEYTYEHIAKRNQDAVMSAVEMSEARMQGECLGPVGL